MYMKKIVTPEDFKNKIVIKKDNISMTVFYNPPNSNILDKYNKKYAEILMSK